MSPSLKWSLKQPEGRATVVNGDLYFSPNSLRHLQTITAPTVPVRFVEKLSVAGDFQEPRWWTAGTEWLGFVPRQEVPYVGVWFGPLGIIPNRLLCENNVEYSLPAFYSDKWLEIDFMLWETCEILRNSYGLKYALPFPPRRWHYHKTYSTWQSAMEHITKGRDWFAMWIGLLYWSTRKVPNGPHFAEGLTPPDWFRTVVSKRTNMIYIDAIRTSQLLQNWWQLDRVGLLLSHPGDAAGQPTVQWFVEQSVPVWYRWGERETLSSTDPDFPLIKPSPEHLQNATTWISSVPLSYVPYSGFGEACRALEISTTCSSSIPSIYVPYSGFQEASQGDSHVFSPMSPQPPAEEHSFDFSPMSPQHNPPAPSPASPSKGPLSNPTRLKKRVWFTKDGDPVWDYGSGHDVWGPFFEKQEKIHAKMLEKESPPKKQARLSRMKHPPVTSCPIYVWDWNDDDDNLRFERTRVRNDDRLSTLNEFSSNQKRYNAFDNEWDCCRQWGEDPEQDDIAEPLPPQLQPHKTHDEMMVERLGMEVGRLLYEYYGWVVPLPLPLPESNPTLLAEENRKALIAVLGLQTATLESSFFHTPLAKAAMAYVRVLVAKDMVHPSGEVWDLSENNRLNLAYSHTLNCIRTIKRGEESWYMFDFEKCRTVPWNIAVPTAASALMVCRLKERLDEATKDRLDESAVVKELVLEGVRFHTVHRRDDLGDANPEEPSSTYVPMRLSDHVFATQDHEFYRHQCRQIMSSPRARAALMRGGFMRRVALRFMNPSEALRGPCGVYDNPCYMFVAKDVNGVEYVDDKLSDKECDMLCGLYYKFTGDRLQVAKVSWFPQCWVFEGSGMDLGRWTEHAERFWEKRTDAILNAKVHNNLRGPLNVTEWRSKLRGLADAR